MKITQADVEAYINLKQRIEARTMALATQDGLKWPAELIHVEIDPIYVHLVWHNPLTNPYTRTAYTFRTERLWEDTNAP